MGDGFFDTFNGGFVIGAIVAMASYSLGFWMAWRAMRRD